MWRKENFHTLLEGMYIGTATVENSMEVPQKTKNRTTIWSSNSTFGIIQRNLFPKKTKPLTWKYTGTSVFMAASFTITKIQKQPNCPSIDEWIKKCGYICYAYIYTHIPWNISYKKSMKIFHLQQCGWIHRVLCLVKQRKTNTVCYHLYMESKK